MVFQDIYLSGGGVHVRKFPPPKFFQRWVIHPLNFPPNNFTPKLFQNSIPPSWNMLLRLINIGCSLIFIWLPRMTKNGSTPLWFYTPQPGGHGIFTSDVMLGHCRFLSTNGHNQGLCFGGKFTTKCHNQDLNFTKLHSKGQISNKWLFILPKSL